eukprot:4675519-Pleurochrysis_carterae.AAC.1
MFPCECKQSLRAYKQSLIACKQSLRAYKQSYRHTSDLSLRANNLSMHANAACMQPAQARALGVNRGVLVLGVPADSNAARAGLRGSSRDQRTGQARVCARLSRALSWCAVD